ncbi:MAG TPA: hypothetical protein VFR74_13535 [Jiangellales bacterium]|nr:hypothetical protein [Jiangellales bacterium]
MRDEGSVHGPADVGAAGSSPPSVDLLVVSANPTVSLSLPDRSVVEVDPARFATWLRSADRPVPRGVVLDAGSPSSASENLAALRAGRVLAPVVLVTDGSKGWLDLNDEGVVQLGPPVTRAALGDAVEALLRLPPVAPAPPTRSRRWALATELAPRLKALDPDPVAPGTPTTAGSQGPVPSTSAPEVAGSSAPSAAVVEASRPPAGATTEPDVEPPGSEDDFRAPAPRRHPAADTREPDASESPAAAAPWQQTPPTDVTAPGSPEPDAPEPDAPEPDPSEVPRYAAPDTPPRPAPDASPSQVRQVPSVLARRSFGSTAADGPLPEEPSAPAAAAGPEGPAQGPGRPAVETVAEAVAPGPWTPEAGTYPERRTPLALVDEGRNGDHHSENGHPQPQKRRKPGLRSRLVPVSKARRADGTTAGAPEAAPGEPASEVPATWRDSHRAPGAVVDRSAPEVIVPPASREVADRSAPPVVDTPPLEVVDRSAKPVVQPPPREVVDRSGLTAPDPPVRRVGEVRVREAVEAPPREVVDRPSRDVVEHPARTEVPSTTAAPHLRRRDVMHLVREILERSDELFVYHLGVVAQAIVDDVIENLPADAACVLVRDDDGGWHVEGASGLRETETQLVLDDDHWLVAQTVRSSAAVAIEDTDIARVQLRGAPLASWPHLMAEGTPDGRALVIAARDVSGQGFTERDVVRIAELCHEGQRYLAAGHEVRTLVRRLSED